MNAFFKSFLYAWAGIRHAIRTQRNLRIQLVFAILAIALAIVLKLTWLEWGMISLTIAMVLILELLNTALESIVDLILPSTIHELAKIAKDCAAGAVLIAAINSALVGLFLFLPPLVKLVNP